MKLKRKQLAVVPTLVAGSCLVGIMTLAAGSPKKPTPLHLVRKIYVAERVSLEPNSDPQRKKELEDAAAAERLRNTYLEAELTGVGFEVVKDKERADAVLSGSEGVTVVMDGDPLDPPEYDYEYHLTPPGNRSAWDNDGEIWKTEIQIRSKTFGPQLDRNAANRIVRKLLAAWIRSAKSAGVKIANKDSVRN